MTDMKQGWSRRTTLMAIGMGGGAVALAGAPAVAATASGKRAELEKASEALRVAMVAGDGRALEALLHPSLSYMHSSGHAQTKENLLRDLAGKRFFASFDFPEQTFTLVDNTGIAIQTVDQVKNLADGKTRASRIKVQQTWVHTGGRWQLLGRVSAIISSPLQQTCAPAAARPAG